MGFDERLSLAMTAASLEWSDHDTKPVEYCAAMAGTSALSSDIHRAKDYDPTALKRAILTLAAKAIKAGRSRRLPLSRAQAECMAIAALLERIRFQCRTCKGAAVVIEGDLKVICEDCAGAGVHRYSDKVRAKMCGIPAGKWGVWQSRYLMVLEICQAHDTAVPDAGRRLGGPA